ncbi:MAG: hypothetical protein M0023_04350 [Desulfobacteraceae bacterium]|nr:hypothetical protein [Desulfobacteraceae bacterium]
MWEFIKISAFWVNIAICCAGIGVAYLWVIDWLLGRLFKYWAGYKYMIEYALNHREFKKWLEARKAR